MLNMEREFREKYDLVLKLFMFTDGFFAIWVWSIYNLNIVFLFEGITLLRWATGNNDLIETQKSILKFHSVTRRLTATLFWNKQLNLKSCYCTEVCWITYTVERVFQVLKGNLTVVCFVFTRWKWKSEIIGKVESENGNCSISRRQRLS